MALTLYCDLDELEGLLSGHGVALRAGDEDGVSTVIHVNQVIEKATADVNLYLFQRYQPAVVAASTWAKWCTAVFAAVDLCRRRGNPVPASLEDEYKRYLEALQAIAAGEMALPADDGLAVPQFDNSPLVTNFRVDSRQAAPIRRVRRTSTESPQAPSRKGYDLTNQPFPY